MRTIWKYQLTTTDTQTISMPAGARILCAQLQHGTPNLWAEVDPAAPPEPRTIRIYGTGNPAPDKPGQYVGTYQLYDGAFVGHVYDRTEVPS